MKKKASYFTVASIVLIVAGVAMFGSHQVKSPIDRLILNEKLARIISNDIKSFKNDSASFLILSGKRLEGDIVILYGGTGLVDPESNLLLREPFLHYDKKGSVMHGGRCVSLAYMGTDTIPDMQNLFDESVLDLPFPNPTDSDNGYCGTHRISVYKIWLITDTGIIELDNDDNLANNYPLQFEYYAGDDEYFLRISPTTQTYELFDGIKETVGNYISYSDTMRLSPKYYYFTSSLLHSPVMENADEYPENYGTKDILVRRTESEIDYYSDKDNNYFNEDVFLQGAVKLWRIHKSGKESYD